ncbi:unnamed protein product [Alternaria alternata]
MASVDLGQDMSGEIGGNDLEDRIMIREEQWEQLEAERESLQGERKKLNVNETEEKRQEKEEQHARRVLIRDRALGLLDFQKNTKLKGKSKVEIAERQNVNVDSLHIPGLSSSKDNIPVLTEPQYSPAGEGLPPPPPLTGLVQDFGTLERARARRADSNRFFACCVGRRK